MMEKQGERINIKRLFIVALFVVLPAFTTGFLLYPWSNIPIGFISTQPLVNPNKSLANFGAKFLGIPSGFDQYQVHIAFNPPKECTGGPVPSINPSFVQYSLQNEDPLVPYMEQVFATTSCENIFSDSKSEGMPQRANGYYIFCLPAGSSVSFLYPAKAPIPLHLTNPPEWYSGNGSCDDEFMKQMEKSPNGLMPYMQIYANPPIGELMIGWIGSVLVWIVIMSSGLTLYEFIRRR